MTILPAYHFQRLFEQLKHHEGAVRNKRGNHVAYRCPAGALTIGYGHNLSANPLPNYGEGSIMLEAEAETLLKKDIEAHEADLLRALPWTGKLDPVRFAVLVNMCFNLGLGGLLTFKNTLRHIERGKYTDAACNMRQSKWARQVGRRASVLARMMDTGQWG